MKYSFLFLAVLAASCGDYNYDNREDRVGDVRSLNQVQMSSFDLDKVTRICNALKVKEPTLIGIVNQPLVFTTTQENCEKPKDPPPVQTVPVVIQNQGGSFVYKQTSNGLDFLFPTVETPSNGVLSGICNSLPELVNPIVNGNQVLYYNLNNIDSDDCVSEGLNEICINVELATTQEDGTSAKVHTKEWIRIRTSSQTDSFIGFETTRKRISKGYCGQDDVLVQKATFKTAIENK